MLQLTDRAREILTRSVHAARRLNPGAAIRLVRGPTGLDATLSDGPAEGDVPAGVDGVFAEAGVDGLLDGEDPHERLVLRPGSSV